MGFTHSIECFHPFKYNILVDIRLPWDSISCILILYYAIVSNVVYQTITSKRTIFSCVHSRAYLSNVIILDWQRTQGGTDRPGHGEVSPRYLLGNWREFYEVLCKRLWIINDQRHDDVLFTEGLKLDWNRVLWELHG